MLMKTKEILPLDIYEIPSFDKRQWWQCIIDVGTAPIVCKRVGTYEEVKVYFDTFHKRLSDSYGRTRIPGKIPDPFNNRRRYKL